MRHLSCGVWAKTLTESGLAHASLVNTGHRLLLPRPSFLFNSSPHFIVFFNVSLREQPKGAL